MMNIKKQFQNLIVDLKKIKINPYMTILREKTDYENS